MLSQSKSRVPGVCISVQYTTTIDLSMLMTDDDHELDRILESTNLDKYELINLPMEQLEGLSHEHTGVKMARNLVRV